MAELCEECSRFCCATLLLSSSAGGHGIRRIFISFAPQFSGCGTLDFFFYNIFLCNGGRIPINVIAFTVANAIA